MRLLAHERCPIHNSYFCCGRVERSKRIESKKNHRPMRKKVGAKWFQVSRGVHRIPDETHPRGYRERRTPWAMTRLVLQKLKEQSCICPICNEEIEEFGDAAPDHIEPRGMGAARRDDHPDNIQAVHSRCNCAKGSIRNYSPKLSAAQGDAR